MQLTMRQNCLADPSVQDELHLFKMISSEQFVATAFEGVAVKHDTNLCMFLAELV